MPRVEQGGAAVAQFTCFTGTTVQILTQKARLELSEAALLCAIRTDARVSRAEVDP